MNETKLRELGRKIKVIICDLDQTLLNSKKEISIGNLQAIKAAQAKGIFVTISSGRIFTMLETYERALAINGPLISTNGAAIVNSRDGQVIWSREIDKATSLKILDYAQAQDYDCSVLTDKACYFSLNSIRIQRFEQYNDQASAENLSEIPLIYLDGDTSALEGHIYKLLINELEPGQIEAAYQYCEPLDDVSVTLSEPGLLEIVPFGVNKGAGVKELKRILSVEKDEVCVFGDYLNDLPMFGEAGFPIAMENAHEKIKKSALVIADHHDNDGVAQAMYKYIL